MYEGDGWGLALRTRFTDGLLGRGVLCVCNGAGKVGRLGDGSSDCEAMCLCACVPVCLTARPPGLPARSHASSEPASYGWVAFIVKNIQIIIRETINSLSSRAFIHRPPACSAPGDARPAAARRCRAVHPRFRRLRCTCAHHCNGSAHATVCHVMSCAAVRCQVMS